MQMVNSADSDVIEIGKQFYIRAQSSLADDRTRSLLHGDTFAVFDRQGDIQPVGFGQQGIFHHDIRHLSRLELQVAGMRPLLLSSAMQQDNVVLSVDLTNPEIELESGEILRSGTLHIHRSKLLEDGICSEQITVHNYGQQTVHVTLSLTFDADFADIFEVRGTKRERRGSILPDEKDCCGCTLSYEGLDQVLRRTRVECSWAGTFVGGRSIYVPLSIEANGQVMFSVDIICDGGGSMRKRLSHTEALHQGSGSRDMAPLGEIDIYTSNEQFNDWLNRSLADLRMLASQTPFGLYPYAGVPWFSTIFGRDGIITALELLWLDPDVARGALSCLAATQSTGTDPERDAQPGKILHELRRGEMAQLREVPFGRYYGSVDSTPLFLLLAGSYYERTGDLDFLRSIWPNIQAALMWIDRYGDLDGDGFVEYDRRAQRGLIQQGWKDSEDAVFHSDGTLAKGPIALCEVQAYVYAAKTQIAVVANDLGYTELATELRKQAEDLRSRFTAAFWADELSMYALALDGDKRQCRVRNSNAGQCLFTGIVPELQRRSMVDAFLSPVMFSGWGIRTIGTGEKRYNPMSYHNGSVWPHDTALIAYGVADGNDKRLALQSISGLFDLSIFLELHRMPELICGLPRSPGRAPTLYPVACSPQAWAAGAVFLLLQSCLGLSVRAKESRIYLYHSALPEALRTVRIRNLTVGHASIDLLFERHAQSVGLEILRRSGDLEVVAFR